jgi:hypothetical protein
MNRSIGWCGVALLLYTSMTRAAAITWTTVYDQTSATTNQLRAVELAKQSGNNSVYTGFIQTTGGNRDVKRFDTSFPYSLLNSRGGSNDQPKAIATDDQGNVFVGNRISGGNTAKITIHNATLAPGTDITNNVPNDQFGGLAQQTIGGLYYLYASRETTKELRRYVYDPTNPGGTIALDNTFATGGVYTLADSTSGILRGLDVDTDGTIYVTSRDDNKVYRISSDLSTVSSATVTRAMDVDLYNGSAYVTSYNGASSLIRAFNATDLSLQGDITVATLDGNAYSRGALEGWGGIDIDATGRIWLGDENYNPSGTTKDRLIVSQVGVPEPGSIAVLLLAAGLFARRRIETRRPHP